DPDFFFSIFSLHYRVSHHENHYSIHEAQSPPTLFALAWIGFAHMQRVLKDKPRSLKADLVLGNVAAALLRVPADPHRFMYVLLCPYFVCIESHINCIHTYS